MLYFRKQHFGVLLCNQTFVFFFFRSTSGISFAFSQCSTQENKSKITQQLKEKYRGIVQYGNGSMQMNGVVVPQDKY